MDMDVANNCAVSHGEGLPRFPCDRAVLPEGGTLWRSSAIGRFSRCPSRNTLVELSILGIVLVDF